MNAFSMWGVFAGPTETNQDVVIEQHIKPCTPSGDSEPGHTWDAKCQCRPSVRVGDNGALILVHQKIRKKRWRL